MVKDLKYIIKRVLIGTLIALALMYFKGGLIGNVYAAEIGTIYQGTEVVEQCSLCSQIDKAVPGNYFATWRDGTLRFTVGIADNVLVSSNYNWSMVLGNAFVTFTGTDYVCKIGSVTTQKNVHVGPNNGVSETGNDSLLTGVYSVECPVRTGARGLESIHLRGLGNSGTATMRIYGPITYQENGESSIEGAINNSTAATNNQTNTIKDESDANTSGFLQDVQQDYTNNPVSDLITMPITFLQRLNNNINGSCTTWNLGSLLGTNLTMPCINLSNILGSTLYNLIDMAICLFLAYNLGLMCVTIWNNMTSLKDDFDDMYSPKHAYNGKHGGDS